MLRAIGAWDFRLRAASRSRRSSPVSGTSPKALAQLARFARSRRSTASTCRSRRRSTACSTRGCRCATRCSSCCAASRAPNDVFSSQRRESSMSRSAVAALAALACAMNAAADTTFASPQTPARPVTETLHGVTLTDRYRWLENGKDAEVVRWTQAQHDAAVAWLDRYAPPVPGLREELTR